METPDVKALFAAVVGGARPESAAAVQACCDAFRQPARNVLALPTSLLSRILRSIKSKIPDDRRGAAEEAFMKLVTKVRVLQGTAAVCARKDLQRIPHPHHAGQWVSGTNIDYCWVCSG